ncbi:MAG: 4-hydroxy-tetrahydrodipicolinate synthase [Christensenellales bacterium]
MIEIKGIIPPIITPMYEDETINYEELRNQVNRQVNGGVHGIFCFGTNGEGYILNDEEKEKVLKVTIETVAGRIPVYAGTGCVGTKDTIRMSRMAKSLGADVLSIITPYFAVASQNEIYDHYVSIAKAVDLPIVVYNIPARTGLHVAPQTIARLAKIDNIVGAKDSSGNFDNMLQYIEQTKTEQFAVLSGNDSLILWNLLAGGTGGVASNANVYPETVVSIYEEYGKGNMEKARKAQDSIRSLRDCYKYGNPNTIIKTAVALLGYPVGQCRRPFHTLPEEGVAAVFKVLDENKQKGMK